MIIKFRNLLLVVAILAIAIIAALTWHPSYPQRSKSDTLAQLEQIRIELPIAEKRWKDQNITNYDIQVTAFIHPVMCADFSKNNFLPWLLEIRQGQINFANKRQKDSINTCDIEAFLPPKVFDTVRKEIQNAESSDNYLQITFDPEYGFMESYSLTSNNGISDLNVNYKFSDFHPKNP